MLEKQGSAYLGQMPESRRPTLRFRIGKRLKELRQEIVGEMIAAFREFNEKVG